MDLCGNEIPHNLDPLTERLADNGHNCGNEGRAEKRMPERVPGIFVAHHQMPQDFEIKRNLRESKNNDAEMPGHRCLDEHAGSHMEWCIGHL